MRTKYQVTPIQSHLSGNTCRILRNPKYQTFDKPEFQGFQYSSMNGVHRNHFQGIKKNQPAYKSAQA